MNVSSTWLYEYVLLILYSYLQISTNAAIVPPPWSDPNSNPCATLPGGWQLLYWPPLKKCFKIFTIGYPCPDTMELSPGGTNALNGKVPAAECRCPPGTVWSTKSSRCHQLYERGPCDLGQYFAPMVEVPETRSAIPKLRVGKCKTPNECLNGMIYWPKDSKCYTLHTNGPCPKGKLLAIGKDKLAECLCENTGDLAQYYYSEDGTCHEHFSRGPCEGMGDLFLPDGRCGCNVKLPHYHQESDQCYELGTVGPCNLGHIFMIPDNSAERYSHAQCQCKEGYSLWKDGSCYRLYTRGPCEDNEFLVNSTSCIQNPCGKGRLYFPEEKTCYRIGTQGPCTWQQVVVFDFTTRPSIDGISYNGVCGCMGIISNLDQKCNENEAEQSACESTSGMIELNGKCYKLYSRGPCGPGQWLEPRKIVSRIDRRGAQCQCRPGYTKYNSDDGTVGCYAPSVGIARWFLRLFGYDN